VLDRILSGIESKPDPRVLVGFENADDAGVYLLDENTALIHTVDFFTPIVDDPFVFGQIAAANALSDVYAMGGIPLTALSILAVSTAVIPEGDIRQMVKGGAAKMMEAGVPVIGGHSIRDREAKLGYCVTGTARPDRIFRNAGACPGDVLILTKPIGTGIVSTAIKAGKAGRKIEDEAVKWMCLLNRVEPEIFSVHEVHAITDITGFGLIGHTLEMAWASEVSVQIMAESVPLIEGALKLAESGFIPGGISTNREYFDNAIDWRGIDETLQNLLLDPQTSGGLLISLPGTRAMELVKLLEKRGFPATIIGRVSATGIKHLEFI
jgi:selenide,water dikinase